MTIFINPGSGPVEDATYENAVTAIEQFCIDLAAAHGTPGEDVEWVALDRQGDGDGRFPFSVSVPWRSAALLVDMPGCDPELTQRGEPWVSPRLYVNGSSWLWGFAVDVSGSDEDGAA